MSGYEPELGQMVFGNATSEYDLGKCETLVADELYALSEELGKRDPDAQVHGFLGGEWGYGQDFRNDTFEMHPYWWGDCECGFEDEALAWEEANPHTPECWQERWSNEHNRINALNLGYDEGVRLMDEWATANGWDGRPGVAVFCDCGQDGLYQAWRETHSHDPECGVVRPNFKYGLVEVRWYKYIGCGMSCSHELDRAAWRVLFAACHASLVNPITPA